MSSKFMNTLVLTSLTIFGMSTISPVISANTTYTMNNVSSINDTYSMLPDNLHKLGSDSEIIKYALTKPSTGITLIDGIAYDKHGNLLASEHDQLTRGKLSWATKALRAAYSKMPKSIKGFIARYTSFEGLLTFIDHFTGTVENAIYQACKRVGMPDWMAWTVTKTLTLFI